MTGFLVTTPDGIAAFQFRARMGALRLETLGLKRSGRSAYSICKREYGLKGGRESVYRQMETMWSQRFADSGNVEN